MVCKNEVEIEEHFKAVPFLVLRGVEDFCVEKTFDCGQCFRFERVEGSEFDVEYGGVAFGKYISVAQRGRDIYIFNVSVDEYERKYKAFLGLDKDYGGIVEDIVARSENVALRDAIEYGRGIRILHQDSWEALCSFIISQNNNIPRIKKIVGALCEMCGERIDAGAMRDHGARDVEYAFPTPQALVELGIDGIGATRCGFRAKYIFDAATRVSMGEIDAAAFENTTDAAVHLMSIKGVGPKVAACTLLFGYARLDAFPVDVWIKRVIEKYFHNGFEPDELGRYAGVAQQFLFYYERYLGGGEA
jgi:N-glycosylase/DNA lyase